MPGFDGTGPRGAGPMTGRGEGYCAVEVTGSGRIGGGYAGLQGTPVRGLEQAARVTRWLPKADWRRPVFWCWRAWAAHRGRGRRLYR